MCHETGKNMLLNYSAKYCCLYEEICINMFGIVSTLIILKLAKNTYIFLNNSIKSVIFFA